MIKLSHFWGAVLLTAGTTIGAAMLALPISTGFMGYFPSLFLFLFCWSVMLLSGFFFVDVNCHYQEDANLVSMAGRTLGHFGRVICWSFYLMLLYALVAAYISGSAPMFMEIFKVLGFHVSIKGAYFSLPVIFGIFFYFGIKGIDFINRILMIGLFLAYLCIIFFIPKHIEPKFFLHHDMKWGLIALPVVLTSFGFHIIIPSLGSYLKHSKKQLKKAVFLGSLLALIVYVIWQTMVLGVVPLSGDLSLKTSWMHGDSVVPIAQILNNPMISIGVYCFAFFAIVTSFLGVSLSLSDFLVDGFKIKKTWEGHLLAYSLTFIPPIFFVLKFQRGFITALEYAGVFVAVLLGILPSLMVKKMKQIPYYQTVKGKIAIYYVLIASILMVIGSLANQLGFFKAWEI
jgi:tyrosine-specific transport protein